MLVTSRKSHITDPIKSTLRLYHDGQQIGKVVVTRVMGNTVGVGVELPPDYRIVREELCQLGSDNKEAAA